MGRMVWLQETGNTTAVPPHTFMRIPSCIFFYGVPISFSKWIVIEHYSLFPLFSVFPKAVQKA